VIRTKLTK